MIKIKFESKKHIVINIFFSPFKLDLPQLIIKSEVK
jgi:hypothetical protein